MKLMIKNMAYARNQIYEAFKIIKLYTSPKQDTELNQIYIRIYEITDSVFDKELEKCNEQNKNI